MAQKTMLVLQNPETRETYYTRRNRKGDKLDNKIELKKYSKKLRKHVIFKEIKGHPKKRPVQKKAGSSPQRSGGDSTESSGTASQKDLATAKSTKVKKKETKKPVAKKVKR